MPDDKTSSPITVAIADIHIGDRHRRDLGDLAELAESIRTEGLLQPIGISPDRQLVFGLRRLKACRDILGWTEIPAVIVQVTSLVAGEFAENTVRKDFTVSERVAIEASISAEIERRQGARTDLGQELGRGRLADETARLAGFGNRETARQAREIVKHGPPELIADVDAGKVSIDRAFKKLQRSDAPPRPKPRAPAQADHPLGAAEVPSECRAVRVKLSQLAVIDAAQAVKVPVDALRDAKSHIAVLPLEMRVATARGFLSALSVADQFRPAT